MNREHRRIQAVINHGPAGGAGGDSPWKKLLMVTGLGCAVLVLVGGLLLGLGVFRVATCCADHGEKQNYLRTIGYQFGEALQNGDYAGAYGMLHESKRKDLSQQAFREAFEHHDLQRRKAFPVAEARHIQTGGDNRWGIKIPFAEPRSSEVVTVTVFAEDPHLDLEEWSAQNVFSHWEIGIHRRELVADEYSDGAMRFHGFLQAREFEGARFLISRRGPLRDLDSDARGERLEELADALESTRLEGIYGLYPEPGGDSVRVKVVVSGPDEELYFLDYVITARSKMTRDVSSLRPADLELPAGEAAPDLPFDTFDEPPLPAIEEGEEQRP